MSYLLRMFIVISCLTSSLEAAEIRENRTTQTAQHTIESHVTGQIYRLFVSLPEGYTQSNGSRYPVVYILDLTEEDANLMGQFYASLKSIEGIPDFIMVGIGFSTDDEHRGLRTAHFTPTSDAAIDAEISAITLQNIIDSGSEKKVTPEMQASWLSGSSNLFAAVLQDELIPFIDTNYNTSGDDALVGHSLAGLFVAQVLFETPQAFERWIISSPSLWWDDLWILDHEAEYFKNNKSLAERVFFSVGELEEADMINPFKLLMSVLEDRQYQGLGMASEVIEGQDHLSVIPIAYTKGLQFWTSPRMTDTFALFFGLPPV